MKKMVICGLMGLICLLSSVKAQTLELTNAGAYEVKEVVEVDSVSAGVLYDRAMLALSDWTGPSGKAKAGLDYHDRDAATVVYKGSEWMWGKGIMGDIGIYADFVMKVRCKDGKAQVTVTIPTMTARYNGVKNSQTLGAAIAAKEGVSGKKKVKFEERVAKVKALADGLVAVMSERLKAVVDDDDF
jgi:hypothetical protein